MQSLIEETKYIMKKYGITASKSLGQNFLIDDEIVSQIIEKSEITNEDTIIEIGPGLGTLTKPMLEKAKKVICIELDKRMLQILNDRFMLYKNIQIINADVLSVNLKELIEKEQHVKVVANLPYYITTPIIMKLLEEKLNIETITVMVQKEVAERLCSTTGENTAGAITHTIRYYTEPEILINVPNNSFIPVPEVQSSVIKLKVLDTPSIKVQDEKLLFKIIKSAYMQRRKTLTNALSNIIPKEKTEELLCILNIDSKIRGEKLTLEQFAEIANYISNN